MLAAHRDQENLVHTTQVPTKQQPKTPGARYPKTPLAFRNNDENVPTAFGGKPSLTGGGGATIRTGRNDKLMAKGTGKGLAMVTPMETRTRPPLGNKTTNAKARADRSAGVKDIVKEIEQTQTKPGAVQKPKQKPAELVPAKLAILSDGDNLSDGGEEPEYAPPHPAPLPYESDVLPKGGLTFEGLNKNFLKGFYEHFHNPVDGNGVSREETKFREEMQAVLKQAEERNEREAASLDWNIEDLVETEPSTRRKPVPDRESAPSRSRLIKRAPQKYPPTIASRRAASALAISADNKKPVMAGPLSRSTSTRRPLSALISGSRAKQQPTVSRPANSAGEAASRTTIGYNKGRTASSMIHSQGGSQASRPGQAFKPSATRDADLELTVTPARMRQTTLGTQSTAEVLSRPQFLSIFGDVDDEDLPSLPTLYLSSDDEDDEFELQLTI